MRILHVEGGRHLYGGAFQVLQLLRGLAARGHQSLLVCRRGCALAEAAAPVARVEAIAMHGDLDLALIWRLRRLIGTWRPQLVHLHSRIGADVMGAIAARTCGVPTVHTRRVDNPEPGWQVALKYRLHDRVIAISAGIGAVLLAEGLPADKLRVVRSAVDSAQYERPCARAALDAILGRPEAERSQPAPEALTQVIGTPGLTPSPMASEVPNDAETLLIGVVAQLIARKGHADLLEVLPPLVARYPTLRVLFLGQGPLGPALRDHIERLGLSGRVLLAGFREDLPDLLPCLDLLVHPAHMEGLGVSLLQAASAGVPIVATCVGGIPEAVRDGENGVLVPPGDRAALGAAIERLLADVPLRRSLGQAGRALMAREFSLDAMVEGNLGVYRELLDGEG